MKYFKLLSAALAAAAVAGSAGAALAHHSFAAEFDDKKAVTVSGVITKARIMNPHSWLYVDVRNGDGSTTNWGFEFGTPLSLERKGVTKADLTPGEAVKVDGFRAKNGGPFGYTTIVTLHDGRKVQLGSAPDAPPAAGGAQ
jgi:hypothetical protein